MWFRRKPQKLLEEATLHIALAMDVLYQHLRDKEFIPTESDLERFACAYAMLCDSAHAAAYIQRCMRQRHRGEPEGARKFADKEAFDWHYPQ